MKAIVMEQAGQARDLKYEEVPAPTIQENEILVEIYAVSINHLDMKKASGALSSLKKEEWPWIPGHDFAGIVRKTGEMVTAFQDGEHVYGNCQGGSYAEYLAADVNKVVIKPEILSFVEAASVPHVAETAWQAIHRHGRLQQGQKVLIHGAAGGVGAYAVQFARIAGAEIYATASAKDLDFIRSLGATHVIDYKNADFTQTVQNADLVLSLVGSETEAKSYGVLKEGGRLVSTVGIQHEDLARERDITAIGMVIEQSAEDLKEITRLINEGHVKPDISVVLPLAEAAAGWEMISGKHSQPPAKHGKIVLEVRKEYL